MVTSPEAELSVPRRRSSRAPGVLAGLPDIDVALRGDIDHAADRRAVLIEAAVGAQHDRRCAGTDHAADAGQTDVVADEIDRNGVGATGGENVAALRKSMSP